MLCVWLKHCYSYAEEPDLCVASGGGNSIFVTLKHRQEARPYFVHSERPLNQTKGWMPGQSRSREKYKITQSLTCWMY